MNTSANSQFPKHVLLRSSWQTANIGDIAHTPGMLALLEEYLPQTQVTLWPSQLSDAVEQMLRERFPKLRVAHNQEEQQQALQNCDLILHGSGPSTLRAHELESWRASGKPYGIGGVTLRDEEIEEKHALLTDAKFVFCRDTLSLQALKESGVQSPVMEFGPDATFCLDLRNDAKADAFLQSHALEPKKFACFVPRLRWTPYWKRGHQMPAGEIAAKEAVNEKYAESDHAKIRQAIIAWVRETGHKALLCPEMSYAVELLRPLLFEALPDDVKPNVVIRPDYWITDEAASVYAQAAAVVSMEMHSPIIAVANNTPAIHVRQPTDTRKGQMWKDVGLEEWFFEVETASGEEIAERLLEIHRAPQAAENLVSEARTFVAQRSERMAQVIADSQ
jgi:polysaccharide pyruvyl transferase WcaK-like protein